MGEVYENYYCSNQLTRIRESLHKQFVSRILCLVSCGCTFTGLNLQTVQMTIVINYDRPMSMPTGMWESGWGWELGVAVALVSHRYTTTIYTLKPQRVRVSLIFVLFVFLFQLFFRLLLLKFFFYGCFYFYTCFCCCC